MSHIFISYSCKNLHFAQKIVDDLAGYLDRLEENPKRRRLEQEVYHGIEGADAYLILRPFIV